MDHLEEPSRGDATDDAAAAFPPLRTSIPVLLVLMLAAMVAYVDRQIINLLIDPIRQTLSISDTQISLLQGVAFGLFYGVFGLPIGFLVDRTNRKLLILAGMLLWSLATAACGLASHFWELFAARAAVAVGEAALFPAAYSLLADLFRPTHRSRAFMAFNAAAAYGVAVSFLVGGGILQLVASVNPPFLPGIGPLVPWQLAFLLCSLLGLVLAPLIIAIPRVERREGVAPVGGSGPQPSLLGFVRSHPRLTWMVCLTYGVAGTGVAGVSAWMGTFFIRILELTPAQTGYVICSLILVGSAVGGLVLGAAGDLLLKRRLFDGKMRILSICAGLSIIGNLLLWRQTHLAPALACSLFVFTVHMGITSMAGAAINELAPNELRGRISAAYLFLTSVVGFSLGPTAVALITDHVFKDPNMIGYSIMMLIVPCMLVTGITAYLVRGEYADVVRSGTISVRGPTLGPSETKQLPTMRTRSTDGAGASRAPTQ